jgi:hypothetical protein
LYQKNEYRSPHETIRNPLPRRNIARSNLHEEAQNSRKTPKIGDDVQGGLRYFYRQDPIHRAWCVDRGCGGRVVLVVLFLGVRGRFALFLPE